MSTAPDLRPITPILSRRAVPWPERPAAFVTDWNAHPLSELLLGALAQGVRTLYLVGGDRAQTTPARSYFFEPTADGWELSGFTTWPHSGHYSITNDLQTRPNRVDVHMSAAWFGDLTDGAACRDSYVALKGALREYFDHGATLMGTPGRTGLDLLQRVLPRDGRYPVLPEALRSLLHANIGQGRMHPTWDRPSVAENLYWLDARWMYAHCLRDLPTGEPLYDPDSTAFPANLHAPAFYAIAFRVPANWQYPLGLLPHSGRDAHGEPRTIWPHTPGTPGFGWCTNAELRFAVERGWRVHVHERITFSGGQPDPARPWLERLKALRPQTRDPHVAAAARALLIQAIGGWARQARSELRSVPRDLKNAVPDEAYDVTMLPDRIDYRTDMPLHPDLLAFQHPEWSGMVWGRSRAYLARAALRYLDETPGGRIMWLRNDALVVDVDPNWPDDLLVGTFRVKHRLVGSPDIDVPADEEGYRALASRRGDL